MGLFKNSKEHFQPQNEEELSTSALKLDILIKENVDTSLPTIIAFFFKANKNKGNAAKVALASNS